jgi:galactose mutarotase-like enzyme
MGYRSDIVIAFAFKTKEQIDEVMAVYRINYFVQRHGLAEHWDIHEWDDCWGLTYTAESDAPTIINLTNHAYWAISGVGKGSVLEQQLMLDADFVLALDKQLVPTGELVPATGVCAVELVYKL